MQLDTKEVLDYIEASDNVIEGQKVEIEKLEKVSSEKDELISDKEAKIQELEKQLSEEQEKVAHSQDESGLNTPSTSSWGTGEKQEAPKGNLRDSERTLYERFGVPIN